MEIYCDNAATTRVHDDVAKAVMEVFLDNYGNPSSQHEIGQVAKRKLKESRQIIADYLGVKPAEIFFTSGGTESDNLALRGLAAANLDKKHIITSTIEHPAILETCKDLEGFGYRVDYLDVDEDGLVDVEDVRAKISDDTLVVSIMHVNNEIGTIEPIEEISAICKEKNVYFHTDAVQSFTKVDIPIQNIDLISVSGHKIGAPKGIGFLYVKEGTKILPIITGGGQESKLRSGTENLPGIVGLAKSVQVDNKKDEIKKSRDKIMEEVSKIPEARINGHKEKRVYHNLNVSFYGIEGEGLMLMLSKDGIYCSTGSACSSTKLEESHVLKAVKVPDLYIHGSIRLTFGVDVIGNEDYIIDKIKLNVSKLREMSPFKFEDGKNE